MKLAPHSYRNRAQQVLVVGLAALLTSSIAFGQSDDSVRRLQEENAALRKRLASIEGQAQPAAQASQAAAPAAARPAMAAEPVDKDVLVLTPFEVKSDKDFGYLKTNSVTATRVGMEIQNVPMNISVLSEEFLKDTNARSVTDLFRYSAAASGDTRFSGMRVPSNENTPQGGFTMRGFQVNNIMRNGVFRYVAHDFDNVERIEVVKGPASVFFGQGYPGGVINFITKRGEFRNIPTTITDQHDSYGGERVLIDQNTMLSKKAAIRFVGGWEDTKGERRFEFRKGFTANPSLTLNPLDSGKIKINLDAEYSNQRVNHNDYEWIYSDFAGWNAASKTSMNTGFLNNVIAASAGNGLSANVTQMTTTPTLVYGTYIANLRTSTGNINLPAYTSIKRGAYYTNKAGAFIYDEDFNYSNRGARNWDINKVLSASIDIAATDWLDIRYVYTKDNGDSDSIGQGGALITPYADGIHWNSATASTSGYYRDTVIQNLDLVLKYDAFGTKNKILFGAQRSDWFQQYNANAGVSDLNYAGLPGARNTDSNPDYAGVNKGKYDWMGVPLMQVIYQRDGSIKPVRQIFSNYDPGFEIQPDVSKFWTRDRTALDGYMPTLKGYYANLQSTLLHDRLTILAGIRKENRLERLQAQLNNFPWYVYPIDEDMWKDPVKYPENVWGHGINYQKTIPLDQNGKSWMAGASYAITPQLSAYASVSTVFKFNTGNIGGYYPGDEEKLAQGLLAQYASIGQSGFNYGGKTITSVAGFVDALKANRYSDMIPNENGMNYEAGFKLTSKDQKIVGTLSIFSANRENRKEDDAVAQSNAVEPFNYSADVNIIAGVNRAIALGATYGAVSTNSGRLFRVRSYGNNVQVQGAEAEVIWTPIRNFQAVINGSYMPQAYTIADNRPVYAKPGTTAFAALTLAQQRDSNILWNARVENIPEYRFNFFGKYTFTQPLVGSFGRGSSIGLGVRYSSQTVVSRSVDWNPLAGGWQAGNYVVADLTVGVPWELAGYKIRSSVGIYNVTNVEYSEGSYVRSPARNAILTNTVSF